MCKVSIHLNVKLRKALFYFICERFHQTVTTGIPKCYMTSLEFWAKHNWTASTCAL